MSGAGSFPITAPASQIRQAPADAHRRHDAAGRGGRCSGVPATQPDAQRGKRL